MNILVGGWTGRRIDRQVDGIWMEK